MAWTALSLEIESAAAEPFGDALLELGAVSVTFEDAGGQWARQRVTVLVDPGAPAAEWVATAAAAAGIAVPEFAATPVEDDDWVRKSQSQFEAFAVDERLWIGPGWREPPPGIGAVVRLDPGLAFGTGSHPTTRLVLRFLCRKLAGGETLLDYGCGSGILAIAAAKLGASRIDAVDIDPEAVETTAANARRNSVRLRALLTDALDDLRYDVIVANILAQPLIVLAPLLASKARPGTQLALSGILAPQADEVAAAYSEAFEVRVGAVEEGWALVEGRRR